MKTFIFDTETTALAPCSIASDRHLPRVVEFYGVTVEDGIAGTDLEFVCDPGVPLPEETIRITGIKPEEVAGKPPFKDWAEAVRGAIESADECAAHNLSYDRLVVDTEFARAGLAPIQWPRLMTCTVEATEWLKGYRLKLSDLHAHLFGEPFAGAHRARHDVEALAKCFNHLRARGDI